MRNKDDQIPFPEYESYMHKRRNIPIIPLSTKKKWWAEQVLAQKVFDSIISRLVVGLGFHKGIRAHLLFRIIRKIIRVYLKIYNRLKVYGKENIPTKGTIFYANHPGSYDPLILMAAIPMEFGALLAWNYSWFMNMINILYGFITKLRYETRGTIVEQMVRQILTKNRYFAIWPEGGPNGTGLVNQGFSSVVRLYSVINSKEDKIPFTPVLIRGGGIYLAKPGIHRGPIEIHIMEPFFLNREWLKRAEKGGKSPREIVDWMMLKIAHKQKQSVLGVNRGLEERKANFQIQPDGNKKHQKHHFHHISFYSEWRKKTKFNNIYKIIKPKTGFVSKPQSIEHNSLSQYSEDISNIHKSKDFHEIYRELYYFKCKCSKKKGFLHVDEQKLIIQDNIYYDLILTHCNNCDENYSFIHDISEYYLPYLQKRKEKRKIN
jgi:1-acyl-sn-glycerol-3-phosphate acyltransferase